MMLSKMHLKEKIALNAHIHTNRKIASITMYLYYYQRKKEEDKYYYKRINIKAILIHRFDTFRL